MKKPWLRSASLSPMHHFQIDALTCYGCAHSASQSEPPGSPSGERPCCFCVRNPLVRDKLVKPETEEEFKAAYDELYVTGVEMVDEVTGRRARHKIPAVWYDQTRPIMVPMDCYQTLDMKQQHQAWQERIKTDTTHTAVAEHVGSIVEAAADKYGDGVVEKVLAGHAALRIIGTSK